MSEEQKIKKAKLVIIGNGFDLAHGYKTGYQDFMAHLIYTRLLEYKDLIIGENTKPLEGMIEISPKGYDRYNNSIINQDTLISKIDELDIKKIDLDSMRTFIQSVQGIIHIEFKNLLKVIFDKSVLKNWVDIEQEYYEVLKGSFQKSNSNINARERVLEIGIKNANETMLFLSNELKKYLKKATEEIIYLNNEKQIVNKIGLVKRNQDGDIEIQYDKVVVLNFNYTNILDPYINKIDPNKCEVIHIHGKLPSSIIFGVGDENHADYKKIVESNHDDFLVNVKSLKYLETSNYTNLRNTLDNYDIDVHMIGHSGGISDRTLLKEVFEHDNCKEINIHHHPSENDPDGKQAYRNISYGVSRYFENNMEMRRKVKPYDASLSIPQYQEPKVES